MMGDLFESTVHRIEAAATSLIGHSDAAVHAVAEDVLRAVQVLRGDVPVLESEAKADAETVVHDAETEGVVPAAKEAEGDAVALAQEAAHDVESAATAPAEPVAAAVSDTAVAASEPTA